MTTPTAVGHVGMQSPRSSGLSAANDQWFPYVVLEEAAGDQQLAITIGQPEAFSLAARLGGIAWPRPMTYQFAAGLVQALGGAGPAGAGRSGGGGDLYRHRGKKGRSAWSRSTRGPATR